MDLWFLSVWCAHDSFNQTVADAWSSVSFDLVIICKLHVMNKLKATKSELICWNESVFGNVHRAVELASKKLKEVQDTISNLGSSSGLLRQEAEAYAGMAEALFTQEQFW